ncbi:hypothetical protein C5167_010245 [Papaver somniferum]|uniref:VOC domain-containing protein n=1 Tax=Papaver somniferum TaxID=3469 RepID=A0A4Y7K2H7_PAPSO|nr:hypothetical protein C5167_010245 [Papaver somniferum]
MYHIFVSQLRNHPSFIKKFLVLSSFKDLLLSNLKEHDIEFVKKKPREMGTKYETALVEEGGVFVNQLFFHDPDGYMIDICNCDNLPIIPLSSSACPMLKKPKSYVDAKKSKALDAVEMETRMMETLFANMIDIAM